MCRSSAKSDLTAPGHTFSSDKAALPYLSCAHPTSCIATGIGDKLCCTRDVERCLHQSRTVSRFLLFRIISVSSRAAVLQRHFKPWKPQADPIPFGKSVLIRPPRIFLKASLSQLHPTAWGGGESKELTTTENSSIAKEHQLWWKPRKYLMPFHWASLPSLSCVPPTLAASLCV